MKSIREKAEEHSFIKQGIDPSGIQYRDFNINKQEGFEVGANYVLEEIENVLNNPYQCTFKTLKANIEELVIKLKEK